MGNFFSKKDDLILDFGGLKTENISSTIPYMNKLNADAKSLVDRLNIKQNTHPVKAKVFTESENYDMYKLFEKTQDLTNDNNFSDTSPFITSDLYKNLIKTQKGGNISSTVSEDESSSSSASSLSDDTMREKKHEKKREKKHEKKHEKKRKTSEEEDDDDFDDELDAIDLDSNENSSSLGSSENSYVSSTAHTDGIDSNNSSVSSDASTVSYKKNKSKGRSSPYSINTSDINMISVEE